MKQVSTLLFAFFIITSSLHAQPGTIDSSFGVNGTVLRNNFPGAYQEVYSRFNGKILVARLADTTAYITQYSNSGIPEKTIRLASVDIQGSYRVKKGTFHIIRANSDGKFFGAGDMFYLDEAVAFVARFNKDGSLDSSFATNGVAQYTAGNFGHIVSLIVQPDNKLLLSVLEIYDAVPEIDIPGLIRYLPDGTRDSSFGANGLVRNVMGHNSMQLQHDGKIILGNGFRNIQLSRRNRDGSLDSTFGKGGTALINVPYVTSFSDNFYLVQLTIQSDNKILAIGKGSIDITANYASCTRINANGKLDKSFADNGFARTPLYASSTYIEPVRAVLQRDGKIIIGGKTGVYFPPTPDTSALLRLNRNGSLDRSFGNNGYVKYAYAAGFAMYDIALQQDGKILTCGSQKHQMDGSLLAEHPYITRYNGDSINNAIVKTDAADLKPVGITINVHPNPAATVLRIYTKENIVMFLTNSWGKIVWTGKVTGSTSINVSQLPAGVYFLSSPKQVTQKIVINH